MYTEEIAASRGAIIAFAILGALPLLVLLLLIALVRIPAGGVIAINGGMVLEAAVVTLLIASLTKIRIVIADETLTVAYRLMFRTRIALHRIVTCSPTDWRGFGISYTSAGTQHRVYSDAKRAVRLKLTNNAEVLFTTRHPDAVCDALRAARPEIVLGAPGNREKR